MGYGEDDCKCPKEKGLTAYEKALIRSRDKWKQRAEAAEQREQRLREALACARPLVEKWCHYQGGTKELLDEYLGPIDEALNKGGE